MQRMKWLPVTLNMRSRSPNSQQFQEPFLGSLLHDLKQSGKQILQQHCILKFNFTKLYLTKCPSVTLKTRSRSPNLYPIKGPFLGSLVHDLKPTELIMYPLGCIFDENLHTKHHKMVTGDLDIEVKVTKFIADLGTLPRQFVA